MGRTKAKKSTQIPKTGPNKTKANLNNPDKIPHKSRKRHQIQKMVKTFSSHSFQQFLRMPATTFPFRVGMLLSLNLKCLSRNKSAGGTHWFVHPKNKNHANIQKNIQEPTMCRDIFRLFWGFHWLFPGQQEGPQQVSPLNQENPPEGSTSSHHPPPRGQQKQKQQGM